MTKDNLLSFLSTIGAPPSVTRQLQESDMGWLAMLMQVLGPIILAWLKKLLEQEREATKLGIDSPITAAIKVFEETGDSKPFLAAAEAAQKQESRLPS